MRYDFLEAEDLVTRSVLVLDDNSKVLVIRDYDGDSDLNQLIYEDGDADDLWTLMLVPEDGEDDSKGDWFLWLGDREVIEIYLPCQASDFIKKPFCTNGKLVTCKEDLKI